MTTLNGWKTTAANRLIIELPLQSFESSLLLVEEYLASVGGWVPVDPGEPTGEGQPANGASPDGAAIEIKDQRIERVHRLDATVSVQLGFQFLANLTPGQSEEDVIAQMQTRIEDFLTNYLGPTAKFLDFDSLEGTVTAGGKLDSAQRVEINNAISDNDYHSDPRAIGVFAARDIYALDSLWNVESIYTEPNKTLMIIVKKFTDTTYSTLDGTENFRYVIGVNPDTYVVENGIRSPITT